MKLFVCLALFALAAAEKVRYDGYKVLTLSPINEAQINLIKSLHENIELDFWTETDVMIPPSQYAAVVAQIDNAGLAYTVKQENVQDELDLVEPLIQQRASSKAYDLYNWNTYDQIVEAIDDWVANCPSGFTCTKESMGNSHLGDDVPALSISSGNKKVVYLDSLIHCREWLAGATTLLIADRLINGNDAEAQRMRGSYNWFIAPVINPDGYKYTWSNDRFWRKNREPNQGSSCIGTDLNRNFDASWGFSGTSTLPCSDTYGGPSAGSAIETQNVQNKLQELGSNVHGAISYHAYANMWLHAYGYTTVSGGTTCATPAQFQTINRVALAARNAVQSTGGQSWQYGPVCTVIYPASGSTVDYAYDKAGIIYAYTPEVRGNSFNPPTSQISPNYLEQWAGMVAMVDQIANERA
jgi:carboxypeptidase A2